MSMRKVIKAYEVVYPNAIRVLKDAVILILREETNPEWAGWLWCRSEDGQEGWISKDYLEVNGSSATMIKDYDAREVAVQPEELVQVLKEEHGWVWVKKSDSSEGWIPLANLEM